MKLDTERAKRLAPFAVPLLIVVVGWMFVIRPTASDNAYTARSLDSLRQRLVQARASVAQPAPPLLSSDARVSFERQVAARDVSYQVFEQLARLARVQGATGLEIATGDQVVVAAPGGPQVAGGGAPPDPRFALFDIPLAYSPIAMSFDAEFARVGEFLWNLHGLATAVEIRTLEITPSVRQDVTGDVTGGSRVHVALTLFVYARQNPVAVTSGASR